MPNLKDPSVRAAQTLSQRLRMGSFAPGSCSMLTRFIRLHYVERAFCVACGAQRVRRREVGSDVRSTLHVH
jgi:hypothetical protein